MSKILNYTQFLNEDGKITQAASDFQDLMGGLLSMANIIKDVRFHNKVLEIIPDGKLGKMDVSLVIGILQDPMNIEKMKKVFNGIEKIKFEKMILEVQ